MYKQPNIKMDKRYEKYLKRPEECSSIVILEGLRLGSISYSFKFFYNYMPTIYIQEKKIKYMGKCKSYLGNS